MDIVQSWWDPRRLDPHHLLVLLADASATISTRVLPVSLLVGNDAA
ncbi:hypothetical protein [Xylanimonas allomyrinae]|nr:hypothetical protein [Xylanimonas allomyrinae]